MAAKKVKFLKCSLKEAKLAALTTIAFTLALVVTQFDYEKGMTEMFKDYISLHSIKTVYYQCNSLKYSDDD